MKSILCGSIACLLPPRVSGDDDAQGGVDVMPDIGRADGDPAPPWDSFMEEYKAKQEPQESEVKEVKKEEESKVEEKKSEVKKETPKKEEKVEKTEIKKEEKKAEAKVEENPDKDIDDEDLKPNAPSETRAQFKKLQGKAKEARAAQRALEAQVKELETKIAASTNGEVPKEIGEKMTKLEKQNMAFFVENSEAFQAKYNQPIESANTQLKDFLAKRQMPVALLEAAIKEGDDWDKWEDVKSRLNEGDAEELADLRRGIRGAKREKFKAAEQLRSEAPKILEEDMGRHQQETVNFWQKTAEHASKMRSGAPDSPGWEREIPADATPEVRKIVEEYNAKVKERATEIANFSIASIMKRDPVATAEICFRAVQAKFLQDDVDELKASIEEKDARIAELEGMIGKSRTAGETSRKTAPTTSPKKNDNSGALAPVKAADAMDDFRANWQKS